MESAVSRVSEETSNLRATEASAPALAASRKLLLLCGAWSGVIGALLAFVANGLHPHPTDFRLEALLQQIAQSRTWGSLHLTLIVALVLILGALVVLTLTTDDEPAATVARFACLAALLGGALILVSTAIDGFAMPQVARAWVAAAPADKATALRIAAALEDAGYAIFSLSIVLFLGLGICLYGLATILSRAYPLALGWLAMVAGAGAFVVGVAQALGGPQWRATEIYFVLFSVLSTTWVLIMGALLWRKAAQAKETRIGSSTVLER